MANVHRGIATVFGVQLGSAAISGAAAFTPKYESQDFSHEYDKKPVTDGDGKVLGYVAVDGLYKGKLTFTVTGASLAAAVAGLSFAAKLATVTLAAFADTSLNHGRWVCTSSKPILKKADHAMYELEIECSEDSGVDLAVAVT